MANNLGSTKKTLEQLYLDRNETGDVTFLVDSQRIRAHRWVLAAASPKYKAQFYGLRPDENEILIPNVSAAAFNEFLQFFYKDSVTLTLENIEAVLDMAKQSLVDEFVVNCVRFLATVVTAKNLCWAYRMSILYDIEPLRVQCEYQIGRNTKDIFATDSFLDCDHEVLLRILRFNSLNCKEKEVFDACIKWARAKCQQTDLKSSPKYLRSALGDAIYEIRFTSMSIEEFASAHKMVEGLFTHDELVEILYMMGRLDGFQSRKFNQKSRAPPTFHQQRMDFVQSNAMPASYLSTESSVRYVIGQTDWRHLIRHPSRVRRRLHLSRNHQRI